jgi:hypothetical protein
VRTKIVNFNYWSYHNFGGDRLELRAATSTTHWTFTNHWSTGGGFNVQRHDVRRLASRAAGRAGTATRT